MLQIPQLPMYNCKSWAKLSSRSKRNRCSRNLDKWRFCSYTGTPNTGDNIQLSFLWPWQQSPMYMVIVAFKCPALQVVSRIVSQWINALKLFKLGIHVLEHIMLALIRKHVNITNVDNATLKSELLVVHPFSFNILSLSAHYFKGANCNLNSCMVFNKGCNLSDSCSANQSNQGYPFNLSI